MKRPSNKEIDRRLRDARKALDNGSALFSNQSKVVGELMELDIGDSKEVWLLIRCLLDEIKLEDYEGWYPPQVNYESVGKGLELWAFCWNSPTLNKRMYLKFSVGKGRFYYVSLHKSRREIRG